MKIKKLIKLLECIEGDYNGKLPKDMYHLGTYTKESGTWEAIAEMDFVHVMRTFKKMQSTLAEEVRRDTQEGKVAYLEEDMAQNYVRKDVYEMLFDKCERLESNLDFLHKKLSSQERARIMRIKDLKKRNDNLQNRIQDLYNRLEKKSWKEVNAPRYMFSEIPNDCDGQRFTDDMKTYLNSSRYSMRVRGQHVKEEYKGTGATAYGQNIEQSTHLRVYIEEK